MGKNCPNCGFALTKPKPRRFQITIYFEADDGQKILEVVDRFDANQGADKAAIAHAQDLLTHYGRTYPTEKLSANVTELDEEGWEKFR